MQKMALEFLREIKSFMEKRGALWVALSISFSLRILYVLFSPRDYSQFPFDSDGWGEIAQNVASGYGYRFSAGEGPTAVREPIFVLWLAGCYQLFEFQGTPFVISQCLWDLGTTGVIYCLSLLIYPSRAVAFLSALFFAVYYPEWLWLQHLLREPFLIFLFTGSCFLFVKTIQVQSYRFLALSSVFMGLTALCKSTVLPLSVLLLITLCRYFPRGKIIRVMGLFGGVIFLVLLPWVVRNYFLYEKIVISNLHGGKTFYVGNLPAADGLTTNLHGKIPKELEERVKGENEYVSNKSFFKEGLKNIMSQPREASLLFLKKALRFWYYLQPGSSLPTLKSGVVNTLIYCFALLGFCASSRTQRIWLFPSILSIAYLFAVHTLVYSELRHMLPVLPLILLLAAFGIYRCFELLTVNQGIFLYESSVVCHK